MDHTDRRSAHRRVGAATIAAFLVLLLLGATRGPAQADTTVPAPAATAAPTVEPSQTLPADPAPDPNADPGFGRDGDHDHDGPGFGHPGGGGGDDGGSGGFGGGAPDSGGSGGGGSTAHRAEHERREPDMSAFMHDVARASLPVAIALLAFTAVARAALWADDPAFVRLGRQYLEPLSVWCLGAVGVQLFAVVAAGDAGALSLLLPIAMGAAAALLRPAEEGSEKAAAPAAAAAPRKAAAPAARRLRARRPAARARRPASSPAPASLWVKRAEEGRPAKGASGADELRQPPVPDRPRADPGRARPLRALRAAPAGVRAREPAALGRAAARRLAAPRAIVGYGVAVAALLVSLAKPQATIAVPTEQARVMIVTDRSGSMLADDVSPNRLAAAKKAAATFLDAIPDKVKVGAVAFNQNAEVLQSPTRDHDAVREALQSVKAAGSTATGDAITAALKSLKGKAPAAIVLLSDGKSVRGSDPLDRRADREGAEDPDLHGRARHRATARSTTASRCRPTRRRSSKIAKATGGKAFTAGDVKSLDQVYKRLGSQVATEKRKLEVTNLFAGGALALMAMSALSSIRMFGRVL